MKMNKIKCFNNVLPTICFSRTNFHGFVYNFTPKVSKKQNKMFVTQLGMALSFKTDNKKKNRLAIEIVN